MKRHGFLIEKTVQENNLSEAFDSMMRGKKRTFRIRSLKKNKSEILATIASEIANNTYTPGAYKEFTILDRGKERCIQSLPFIDRIALHAIMNTLGEIFYPRLIRDTYASIPGRGIHDGLKRVRNALKDKQGTSYCLKFDIRKYYNSISQDILIEMLCAKIKDKRMIETLVRIIRSYHGAGLPIGFHSSQLLGNFYLGKLDEYVKSVLGVKYYFRYCDDIIVLAASKEELHSLYEKLRLFVENKLCLTIKGNYQLFPVEARGISFLGYVIRHDHVFIRKHIKKRAAKLLHKVKSKKRKRALIASLYGWTKHGNCKNLFLKLTRMKNFSDLNIKYTPKDGKRRFEGALTPLGNLQNCEITILDFETGINTKQGEGRYVIQYEQNGVRGKFITNSEEMKDILDQVKERGELPFAAIIKRVNFGQNKTKYIFT